MSTFLFTSESVNEGHPGTSWPKIAVFVRINRHRHHHHHHHRVSMVWFFSISRRDSTPTRRIRDTAGGTAFEMPNDRCIIVRLITLLSHEKCKGRVASIAPKIRSSLPRYIIPLRVLIIYKLPSSSSLSYCFAFVPVGGIAFKPLLG
jgi:hypothetical protein